MYIPFRSFHQKHTMKNIVWGELKRYVCYNTEEKIFKNSDVDFFTGCAIVGSRNMFSLNYSSVSHIRKGINFSIQSFLFLMFVNHLLFRKQKGGFFWKERQRSAFRKGTRQLPILVSIPRISDFLSTTSNSNNTTARQDTRTFGHHQVNTSTEGSSSFRQAT